MLQQYRALRVLAIDDRSTDKTGQIVDEFAERYPERVAAIHIDYFPEGWLGKTFALEVGTRNSTGEYLLFTDADVLFSPSSLRRAMAFAAMTQGGSRRGNADATSERTRRRNRAWVLQRPRNVGNAAVESERSAGPARCDGRRRIQPGSA